MKIEQTKKVTGTERIQSATDQTYALKSPTDKVTVGEAHRATELIRAAQSVANSSRAMRLESIERAIKSGGYRPDASRIADQILTAAEVDARLRAFMSEE